MIFLLIKRSKTSFFFLFCVFHHKKEKWEHEKIEKKLSPNFPETMPFFRGKKQRKLFFENAEKKQSKIQFEMIWLKTGGNRFSEKNVIGSDFGFEV